MRQLQNMKRTNRQFARHNAGLSSTYFVAAQLSLMLNIHSNQREVVAVHAT